MQVKELLVLEYLVLLMQLYLLQELDVMDLVHQELHALLLLVKVQVDTLLAQKNTMVAL